MVSANWYGKISTVIFYLAIIMLIFDEPFGRWNLFGMAVNLLVFILAVIAALFAFSCIKVIPQDQTTETVKGSYVWIYRSGKTGDENKRV